MNILYFVLLFIDILSFTLIYKKICKEKKVNLPFTFLCFGFLLLKDIIGYIGVLAWYSFYVIEPLFIYFYLRKYEKDTKLIAAFLTMLVYQAALTSETFLSVIISSVTGDDFVTNYSGIYFIAIDLLSLFIILKLIDYFDINIYKFLEPYFREYLRTVTSFLLGVHLFLNISHWISNFTTFNSFASMITTICFLAFIATLLYLKSIREKFEKEVELEQKKKEQLQLQQYTDEIVDLYNEIKGFRHDYGGMLVSFQAAIDSQNMAEVERIYQDVLVRANEKLSSDRYTSFDLNNVGDSALRSMLTQTLFKAREHQIELTFEIKDYVGKLPIQLLDLVRMTSILLNNAVEGAAESIAKTLNVSLVDLEGEVILVIQNSRKDQNLQLNSVYQRNFSTKGEGRGTGLTTVKEMIDQYEGLVLDTEITKEHFTQVLRIRKVYRL
ncbi:signal transduction protein [Streptococcus himalayensis]|uniref:Signal transduction protein n=2 Tax=Streptococcus himalayensis TaxID=1888195 RepID=A0A917ECJ1_9STRE|nr:GHKL domain-containing protein [Streptococcus himalayensis]GGE23979.1 signal transduction protein [Streptococcus himalayensis]